VDHVAVQDQHCIATFSWNQPDVDTFVPCGIRARCFGTSFMESFDRAAGVDVLYATLRFITVTGALKMTPVNYIYSDCQVHDQPLQQNWFAVGASRCGC